MPLRPNQRTAALLLGRGMPIREVAEKLGISKSTIHKWKNRHPEFVALIDAERKYINSGTEYAWHIHAKAIKSKVSGLITTALDAMKDQLENGKNEMAKIKAATYVLDKFGTDHIADIRGKTESADEEELLTALRLVDGS
jgi:transposase-like protein